MKHKLELKEAKDIRVRQNSWFDAWLFSMLMDNNIIYDMNPQILASPEQIRFMVAMAEDQIYIPCDEYIFCAIQKKDSAQLQAMYNRAWRIVVRLICASCTDREDRRRRLFFCKYRFRQCISTGTLIPSRLVKRLIRQAFFEQDLNDLWAERRRESCVKQKQLLQLPVINRQLQAVEHSELCGNMLAIHNRLNYLELSRKMYLSMMSRSWLDCLPSENDIQKGFEYAVQVSKPLEAYFSNSKDRKTILFLVDSDGGIILDMAMLTLLEGMGHRIIVAVKESFHFYAPTLMDMQTDPSLENLRRHAHVVLDSNISKNTLLQLLHEHKLLIISDGTQERMNLTRVSVTFSRAWKEADLVIAKGWRSAGIFLHSSHQFTRDILCYWLNKQGQYCVEMRPCPATVYKFSEKDLIMQADKIICQMRDARRMGKKVMFYSCIIGSIPGQMNTAIKVVDTFVEDLRNQQENVLVINPTEHFIEGMDGDDLMFMWEKVQRSGYIDVWRFQTVKDIEKSFQLLGRKVPPAWAGKDSTYSTGCTKEMRIAMDMQQKNRELQIIGPDSRMFFRRGEYGVGKYFDVTIN